MTSEPAATTPSNPALRAALDAAAESTTTTTVGAVHTAVLEAMLVIPYTGESFGEPGENFILTEPREIGLLAFHADDGRVMTGACTDVDALHQWLGEGQQWVGLAGPAFCGMLTESSFDAIVLNPAGPSSGVLQRRDIEALGAGRVPDDLDDVLVPQGTRLAIGPIDDVEVPTGIEDRLATALQTTPVVTAAYLFALSVGEGAVGPAIGLLFAPGTTESDQRRAFEVTGAAVTRLQTQRPIDLMPVDDALLDEVGEYMQMIYPRP